MDTFVKRCQTIGLPNLKTIFSLFIKVGRGCAYTKFLFMPTRMVTRLQKCWFMQSIFRVPNMMKNSQFNFSISSYRSVCSVKTGHFPVI